MSSENFPAGMRVLVVDDDPLCLMILERMLRQCSYTVTTCSRAATALSLLRENRDKFDLVISDVYMPDMDGFKLLELIGLELDLPVIMMSANGETSAVMKGITHGACDYLLKPVRIEELRNIWQHVVRKSRREAQREDPSGDWDENTRPNEDGLNNTDLNSRKRKEKPEPFSLEEHIDDANSLKRARVVWSIELHQQFVNAVNQLGIDKAVPKRILEIMNVQGLTRENVASHLQKYRLYLKRLSGVTPQPHPVAAFQPNPTAAEGKGFGGTMTVIPGGRGAAAISKPVSLPLTSPTSNSSPPALPPIPSSSPSPSTALLQNIFPSFSRGPLANIDAPTLATLAQLQALQKHAGGGGNGLNANLLNAGVNPNGNNGSQMNLPLNQNLDIPGGIPGLSGLSALDLNLLMQQTQQDSMGRQRLRGGLNGDGNLNAFQGNLPGLGNLHMRMGLSGNNGGANGNGNGNLNGGIHNSPLLPIQPNSNSSALGDVELGSMGKPPSLSLMTALGVSDRGNAAPTLQLGNNANSNGNNNANSNGEFQGNGSVNPNSNVGGAPNGMNQEGGLASFTELTGEDYLNNIGGNGGGGNELSSAFINQLMGNGRNVRAKFEPSYQS